MVCLRCNHTKNPDPDLMRTQSSKDCGCGCHPWNQPKGETNQEKIAKLTDVQRLREALTIGFQYGGCLETFNKTLDELLAAAVKESKGVPPC